MKPFTYERATSPAEAVKRVAARPGARFIGGGTNYDEFILPSMGDEVIGDVSSFMYSSALETPKNEAFVKSFRAKYGKVPSYFSESNYTTAMMIDMVMKQTKGAWPGPEAFIAKLEGFSK